MSIIFHKNKPFIIDFQKIAVFQTAFIGDNALSLYLAQSIKNLNPKCQLSFITTPLSASLVACLPAIDKVITFDKKGIRRGYKGIKFMSDTISSLGIECIISCHRSIRTTLITYLSRPKYSVGFNISSGSLLYKYRVKYEKSQHDVYRNLNLLNAFSDTGAVKISLPEISLDIHNSDKSYIDTLLLSPDNQTSNKIAILSPGSIWETKKWKEEHFESLIGMLLKDGYRSILIGSERESEICLRISSNTNSLDLSGKTSIPQLLYLLSQADILITNDSAPTHLAGLVNCPVVTIFGPTSPMFGFAPIGKNSEIAELKDLSCKPCEIHGGNHCPVNTHECMVKLLPDIVYEKCNKILKIR